MQICEAHRCAELNGCGGRAGCSMPWQMRIIVAAKRRTLIECYQYWLVPDSGSCFSPRMVEAKAFENCAAGKKVTGIGH